MTSERTTHVKDCGQTTASRQGFHHHLVHKLYHHQSIMNAITNQNLHRRQYGLWIRNPPIEESTYAYLTYESTHRINDLKHKISASRDRNILNIQDLPSSYPSPSSPSVSFVWPPCPESCNEISDLESKLNGNALQWKNKESFGDAPRTSHCMARSFSTYQPCNNATLVIT